jgi:large subunit ribosomal protein L25
MKTVAMFGYKRTDLGKAATKLVRAEGKVPCVLYGGKEHCSLMDMIYVKDLANL